MFAFGVVVCWRVLHRLVVHTQVSDTERRLQDLAFGAFANCFLRIRFVEYAEKLLAASIRSVKLPQRSSKKMVKCGLVGGSFPLHKSFQEKGYDMTLHRTLWSPHEEHLILLLIQCF